VHVNDVMFILLSVLSYSKTHGKFQYYFRNTLQFFLYDITGCRYKMTN